MKYLKPYPVFESSGLNLEQEEFINKYTKGTWSLNSEGLVDIVGDFNCSDRGLKNLSGVNFGTVTGNFNCHSNKLKSLIGSPQKVHGIFYCFSNQLTTLEGSPNEVGGSFFCFSNQLTSLDGGPREVGVNFNCSNNQLISLIGSPKKVSGNFYCYNNQLTSLEGVPQEVGGDLNCSNNQLTSLEGYLNKYRRIYWSEGYKSFVIPPLEGAIEGGSVLVWDLVPLEDRSNKLNDFIENDPSKIDKLNVLFDREWYTPSPYALAIYKAWKRGL